MLVKSDNAQGLNSSKAIQYSLLERLVWHVYFPCFLLTIVFYYVSYINISCIKECFRSIWICKHPYSNLLTLNFKLLCSTKFFLHFSFGNICCFLFRLIYFPQFLCFLSSHLLNQLLFILFIFFLLNFVKLKLSLHCLLLCNPLSLNHLFSISGSIFFSFSCLFFFDFLSLFSSFFS